MRALFGDYDYAISLPCSEIRKLKKDEIDLIVDAVIDHYYKNGFPYYEINPAKIRSEYAKLKAFDVNALELPDNHLQQNMLGLNTVNSFHPEMWETRCRNAKTPMEVFLDRDAFREALLKRIKYSDTKLAPFNIRKSLKAFGVQAVSNFRPTVAKWVYQKYSPENGFVFDPCAGWGGRLFGAFCSHVGSYIGVDPNANAIDGNQNLYNVLRSEKISLKERYPACQLYNMPFEDIDIRIFYGACDLVFTSPPYFDLEKYSDQENTQSYVRYKTYDEWINGFLIPLFEKSNNILRTGGYLALNVGNPIIEDTERIGSDIFGKPEMYHMRLSKILGRGDKNNVSHKTEPIFIWRKE